MRGPWGCLPGLPSFIISSKKIGFWVENIELLKIGASDKIWVPLWRSMNESPTTRRRERLKMKL